MWSVGMSQQVRCRAEDCHWCREGVSNCYNTLCAAGSDDRHAFMACVDLLEGLHPGFPRNHYFRCVAQLLGGIARPADPAA
jgi:hypothetical protein